MQRHLNVNLEGFDRKVLTWELVLRLIKLCRPVFWKEERATPKITRRCTECEMAAEQLCVLYLVAVPDIHVAAQQLVSVLSHIQALFTPRVSCKTLAALD